MKLPRYVGIAAWLITSTVIQAADAPPPPPPAAAKVPEEKAVTMSNPRGLAVDKDGNLYVGDVNDGAIYKMNAQGKGGVLGPKPTAGATTGNDPQIATPTGVAVDKDGNVYVADADSNVIRKISAAGKMSTLAGKEGLAGEADGKGDVARFNGATCVAVDAKGNVLVGDTHNGTVRKITPDGTVTTLTGNAGADQAKSIDGKLAEARFGAPRAIAIDSAGIIYVGDESYGTIRKISPDGMVTTLAGNSNSSGAPSKDGKGIEAIFGAPRGLGVDAKGNVYVADTESSIIRKITPTGVVTTLAGKLNTAGFADGPGEAARFGGPRGLAVDKDGNIYVADSDNGVIRKITPDGVVRTVGGTAPMDANNTSAPTVSGTAKP